MDASAAEQKGAEVFRGITVPGIRWTGRAEIVGMNRTNIKDANGVFVIPELAKLAKNGGGWLKYLWANPLHNNKVEPKLGYVEKVDDTWFLGSGMYE